MSGSSEEEYGGISEENEGAIAKADRGKEEKEKNIDIKFNFYEKCTMYINVNIM